MSKKISNHGQDFSTQESLTCSGLSQSNASQDSVCNFSRNSLGSSSSALLFIGSGPSADHEPLLVECSGYDEHHFAMDNSGSASHLEEEGGEVTVLSEDSSSVFGCTDDHSSSSHDTEEGSGGLMHKYTDEEGHQRLSVCFSDGTRHNFVMKKGSHSGFLWLSSERC